MDAKLRFLSKLTVISRCADGRAMANPGNQSARRFAREVGDLLAECRRLPEGHQLFRNWQRRPWLPVAWSDGPGAGER